MNESIQSLVGESAKHIVRNYCISNAVKWCERKRDDAKDGETAYHYHQLAEMWRSRLGS